MRDRDFGHTWRASLVAAGLHLTACAVVNSEISQLDSFKRYAAAGDWAAIANSGVSCGASSSGCAQLHEIKADACMRQGAGVSSYDCAIAQYQAAIQARQAKADTAVSLTRLRIGELDALGRRRDQSRSTAEALPFNTRLLTEAAALIQDAPDRPDGYYYLADGLLAQGLAQRPPQACDTLGRAAHALDQAAVRPNAPADAIAQRRRDVANGRAGQCPLAPA
ncbi:hypothetical protein [Azospirillum sp. B4]|uniref:hypothetical protein n=1 Tax=Azospirillum sp. B4 TaxID=95605 RepID=UPI00034BD1DC|nr:hypothetical protein [Azospirillum sp. B4]